MNSIKCIESFALCMRLTCLRPASKCRDRLLTSLGTGLCCFSLICDQGVGMFRENLCKLLRFTVLTKKG